MQSELQEALNAALRVRDSLSGIDSNPRCPHDLWASAMAALKSRNRSLDAKNVDRLFSRDNRQVLMILSQINLQTSSEISSGLPCTCM